MKAIITMITMFLMVFAWYPTGDWTWNKGKIYRIWVLGDTGSPAIKTTTRDGSSHVWWDLRVASPRHKIKEWYWKEEF